MSDFVELDSSYGRGGGGSQANRLKERVLDTSREMGSKAKYQFKRWAAVIHFPCISLITVAIGSAE